RGGSPRRLRAFRCDVSALPFASCAVSRSVNRLPPWPAVDEMRGPDRVLKELRTAIVVGVGVRNDDVLDLVDVQAKFLHPPGDLVRRGIVKERLEDDDSFAASERPGAVDLGAEEVEVV